MDSIGCLGYLFQSREQAMSGLILLALNSKICGVWAHSSLPVLLSGGTVHLPHIVRHFAVDGHLAWYPVDTVTDKVAVNVREHSLGAHGHPSMSFWVIIGIKFSSFSSSLLPPSLL